MGEAAGLQVISEWLGQLSPRQTAVRLGMAPRADMHLIDRDRPVVTLHLGAVGHPGCIAPVVLEVGDDRRRRRRQFRGEGHRVGALDVVAGLSSDAELVTIADLCVRCDAGPKAAAALRVQAVRVVHLPVREVSNGPHLGGFRGPDGQATARIVCGGERLCSQHIEQATVAAFVEEPAITLWDQIVHIACVRCGCHADPSAGRVTSRPNSSVNFCRYSTSSSIAPSAIQSSTGTVSRAEVSS